MVKTNHNFTQAELAQTDSILKLSQFDNRPLVKGFTIDSETSLDLDDAIWVETYGDI